MTRSFTVPGYGGNRHRRMLRCTTSKIHDRVSWATPEGPKTCLQQDCKSAKDPRAPNTSEKHSFTSLFLTFSGKSEVAVDDGSYWEQGMRRRWISCGKEHILEKCRLRRSKFLSSEPALQNTFVVNVHDAESGLV